MMLTITLYISNFTWMSNGLIIYKYAHIMLCTTMHLSWILLNIMNIIVPVGVDNHCNLNEENSFINGMLCQDWKELWPSLFFETIATFKCIIALTRKYSVHTSSNLLLTECFPNIFTCTSNRHFSLSIVPKLIWGQSITNSYFWQASGASSGRRRSRSE